MPSYFIFANKPKGEYSDSIWDTKSILESGEYYFETTDKLTYAPQIGDIIVFKEFGSKVFWGEAVIEENKKEIFNDEAKRYVIRFLIDKITIWPKAIEVSNVLPKLSKKDTRNRIISITESDYLLIKSTMDGKKINDSKNEIRKMKLNQILYGPPGTGKTFYTINHALAVIGKTSLEKIKELENTCDIEEAKEFFEDLELETEFNDGRKLLRAIFDFYVKKGQIVFTTFHQSMSYEDFIEGIKPLEPKEEGANVNYKVIDGIFKSIAKKAAKKEEKQIEIGTEKQELTEELFTDLYRAFADTLAETKELDSKMVLKTKEGADFWLFRNSAGSITIRAGVKKTNMSAALNELTDVLFNKKEPTYKSYERIIIDKILESVPYQEIKIDNAEKNYVLIIDEINRGNVSAIFGELITLIETDKRQGMPEALEVTLPYSKEPFSVPQNLYIIGTMNTADRSVEALDTALRRRFTFVEMMPKAELLTPYETLKRYWLKRYGDYGDTFEEFEDEEKPLWDLLGLGVKPDKKEDYLNTGNSPETYQLSFIEFKDKIDELVEFKNGINLQTILETINNRIEILLDRDHLIGHSYFMNVYSLEELKETFTKNIIPLLQEYFYGDYGKIALVLGEGFCKAENFEAVFAKVKDYNVNGYSEKKNYRIVSFDDKFKIEEAIDILLNKK